MAYKLKKHAIILKGDEVLEVIDYPVLYKSLINDPEVTIFEDCDEDLVKEKLLYWDNIVHYDPEKVRQEEQEFLERNKLLNQRKRK